MSQRLRNKDRSAPASVILRVVPGNPTRARLILAGSWFDAAIGRSGLARKRGEGDGITPRGAFACLYGFYRRGRRARPVSRLAFRPSRGDEGWCDAPSHPAYNCKVRLPFAASHETLWREDRLYDALIVIDYNVTRRQRGAGSAIFLHIAREKNAPTEGCIALTPKDFDRLCRHLGRGTRIVTL
ncbi:MAG: L,D-transpeptidase family protein [Hyphomicrobiaceae bacterium]|nr:L,D-transpeptidase family protein [Hyphomicrobiaceae bacterium]